MAGNGISSPSPSAFVYTSHPHTLETAAASPHTQVPVLNIDTISDGSKKALIDQANNDNDSFVRQIAGAVLDRLQTETLTLNAGGHHSTEPLAHELDFPGYSNKTALQNVVVTTKWDPKREKHDLLHLDGVRWDGRSQVVDLCPPARLPKGMEGLMNPSPPVASNSNDQGRSQRVDLPLTHDECFSPKVGTASRPTSLTRGSHQNPLVADKKPFRATITNARSGISRPRRKKIELERAADKALIVNLQNSNIEIKHISDIKKLCSYLEQNNNPTLADLLWDKQKKAYIYNRIDAAQVLAGHILKDKELTDFRSEDLTLEAHILKGITEKEIRSQIRNALQAAFPPVSEDEPMSSSSALNTPPAAALSSMQHAHPAHGVVSGSFQSSDHVAATSERAKIPAEDLKLTQHIPAGKPKTGINGFCRYLQQQPHEPTLSGLLKTEGNRYTYNAIDLKEIFKNHVLGIQHLEYLAAKDLQLAAYIQRYHEKQHRDITSSLKNYFPLSP